MLAAAQESGAGGGGGWVEELPAAASPVSPLGSAGEVWARLARPSEVARGQFAAARDAGAAARGEAALAKSNLNPNPNPNPKPNPKPEPKPKLKPKPYSSRRHSPSCRSSGGS